MKRTIASVVASGVILTLCLAWTISRASAAEPAAEPSKAAAPATEPGKAGTPSKEVEAAAAAELAQSPEIKEAIEKFKVRDFDGTLKLLKQAVQKNSELPPAEVIMALLFSQANIPAGVRSYLEQAVVEAPGDPEAYVIMGDVALRERRVVEAKMLYEKAQSLMDKFDKSEKRKGLLVPRILSGLAGVAESRTDWSGSQKELEAWLKVDPKNVNALQRLAQSLFQQKNPDGALEKLKEAAKADPEMLVPEAILAQFCQQGGDRENAKKWMAKALAQSPRNLKLRLAAAQWALETEQLKDAQTQAKAAMQLDPKSLDAQILCGVVSLFEKDYAAAERYFEAAHLQTPSSFAAANNLALALVEQKDEAKKRRALELAEADAKQFPKLAEAASTYGWVLYKLGRFDEAQRAFQVAVSGGQFSPDTAYYIAQLSYDRGREADAKQWLDLALRNAGPFAMREDAKKLLEKLKK